MANRPKFFSKATRLQVFNKSLIVFLTITTIALNTNKLLANELGRKLGSLISTTPDKGSFSLISNDKSAALTYSSNDFAGVAKAMNYFKSDLKMVSGNEPQLAVDALPAASQLVIAGTLGHSKLIDQLVSEKKIDLSILNGKWEQFIIQVVEYPFPGIEKALIIAGSDKRGTIFGIFELSKQMGVSPWHWWADVPVETQSNIYVKAQPFTLGEPAVKYRGIFLNDEEPALGRWAVEKFGGFNSQFYEKLFELVLRMKSNFVWPAMWWGAFNSNDPKNTQLADDMGIVMGTSHHEPMNRAHAEWKPFGGKEWNYEKNPEQLRKFWTEGIERTKNVETIVTLAMRGDGDMAMSEGTNVALLQKIVEDQRKIISDVAKKPITETPQVWALYKEVQDYYDNGMRVPDDVTLLLCDDNWGNIRKLPKPGEAKRSGGYGIYYHFDYVGDPRNYKWLNTTQIQRTWEQMNLAYRHGVDRIWVVNVGDLKPMEFPIEFFLDFAWNPDQWPADKLFEYTRQWAENQFGAKYATEIASLLNDYTRFNSRRKPELLEPTTYSLTNYAEAERIANEYNALADKAKSFFEKMPAKYKDAFYQLVLHPVAACANLNDLYVTVGKNRMYAAQGRVSANDMAEKAKQLYQTDAEMSDFYNKKLAGGKWNHMMDQTHIGYTYWQQPNKNSMPKVETIVVKQSAEMGIAIEGSDKWWPESTEKAILPQLDPIQNKRFYIDVFNRGSQPFDVVIKSASKQIKVSAPKAGIDKELRIWVEADWKKMSKAITEVPITISGAGKTVEVIAVLNPLPNINRKEHGFAESNGYIAIEAEHYTNLINKGEAGWQKVPGLGRTLSAMMPVPVNSLSIALDQNSPRMEYYVLFDTSGEVTVSTLLSPTLNIYNNMGLCFAVSLDDEQPQIVNIHKGKTNQDWQESVRCNIVELKTKHTIGKAGKHILKLWMIDPGIVLQRILIDCGGLKPSYLGPLESKKN
ncbi:MAG: glycosyl hydrolase 115 family protein [Bacteroidota bacterium]